MWLWPYVALAGQAATVDEIDPDTIGAVDHTHGVASYARPRATRIMSTSLMPGNGMMIPPIP